MMVVMLNVRKMAVEMSAVTKGIELVLVAQIAILVINLL
jgi:hypothetical protein